MRYGMVNGNGSCTGVRFGVRTHLNAMDSSDTADASTDGTVADAANCAADDDNVDD